METMGFHRNIKGYGTVMKHTGSLGLEETHITHTHTHIVNIYIYIEIEHSSSFLFVCYVFYFLRDVRQWINCMQHAGRRVGFAFVLVGLVGVHDDSSIWSSGPNIRCAKVRAACTHQAFQV